MDMPATNNQPTASIPEIDFSDPATLESHRGYIRYLALYDFEQQAYNVARQLPRELENLPEGQLSAALQAGYYDIIALARGIAFSMLTDEEALAYLRHGAAIAFKDQDLIFLEKVKGKVITHNLLSDREAFKKQLLTALNQNDERITLQNLSASGVILAPTIGNWLKQALQLRQGSEVMIRALVRSENYDRLSEGERRVVDRIMVVYDYLELSPLTPAGIDEPLTILADDGQRYILDGDEVRPAVDEETDKIFSRMFPDAVASAQAVAPTEIKDRLLSTYMGAHERRRTVVEASNALYQETAGEPGKVRAALFEAIKNNNGGLVLAGIFLLARLKALAQVLDDPRFASLYEKNVLPAFASRGVTAQSAKSQQLRAFLQFFMTRAVGNEEEAAQLGAQLASIMVASDERDFLGLAVFSTKSGKYEWRV